MAAPIIDAGQTNFVTEQLLSGNVTLNLVIICFAVASVAVGITLWAVYKFQTKDEARDTETALRDVVKINADLAQRAVEETKTEFNRAISGIHEHMTTMKTDNKIETRQLQAEVSGVRTVLSTLSNDIGFLRGLSERRS